MKLAKRTLLKENPKAKLIMLIAAVVATAISGYIIVTSHAAGSFVIAEGENGVLTGNAATGADASASGGHYLLLNGSGATPTPTPSPSPSPGSLPAIRGFIENSDSAHADLFKTLGFTATYFPASTSGLDDAASKGMKAIVWLGDYDNTNCVFEQSDATITSTVNAIKGKSALLGYFLADEPEQASGNCPNVAAQLKARSDLVRAADPNTAHFTYTIISNEGTDFICYNYAKFMGTTDVMGLDIYPFRPSVSIPCVSGSNVLADISNAISAWNNQSAAYKSSHPSFTPRFYAILQDFQDSNWRRPTVTELQQQWAAWQNSGMEGVWYFSWDWQGNSLDTLTDHQCQFKIENQVVPSC